MVPWHMGAMHPFEQVLTLILAFGPFLVLGGWLALVGNSVWLAPLADGRAGT